MWILLEEGDVIREGDECETGGGNGYGWCLMPELTGKLAGRDIIVRRNLTGWAAVTHALKKEVLGNDKEGCETTMHFWDCECERDHINRFTDNEEECPCCGTSAGGAPMSRKAEVILEIIEER